MKASIKFFQTLMLLFFFASVLFGTFSACTMEEENYKIYAVKEGRFDVNENEYVMLEIFPEAWTDNESVMRRIENFTERHLGYDYSFSMEYFNKNNWETLSIVEVYPKIGLGLAAGMIEVERMDLFRLIKKYNKGKKGNYKFTQRFDLCGNWPVPGNDIIVFSLSAEFEIN